MSGPTVLLLAGEASGDEHGAALVEALRKRRPDLRFLGTGGPRMADAGVELLAELADLAVMGIAEVLPKLPFLRRLARRIEAVFEDRDVALVVPIDYPGFNMRMAREARRRGRKVLYYVPPKVWAWRQGRARTLARITDRVATILPFETEALVRAGVRAEYVGSPLVDHAPGPEDQEAFRARWGLDPARLLLALLPGSRLQEISRHLDLFVETGRLVAGARPDVLPVVSRAVSVAAGPFGGLPFPVVEDARGLLRHAHAAVVKSGTATLEAAIEDTPSVIAYRTGAVTWAAAKALVRVEHVGLPNLIAGERIVPELLQGAATAEALAREVLSLLDADGPSRAAQLAGFARVRAALGPPGAAARVADMALDLMGAAP